MPHEEEFICNSMKESLAYHNKKSKGLRKEGSGPRVRKKRDGEELQHKMGA